MVPFEAVDVIRMGQGEVDRVPPLQKLLLGTGIDFEPEPDRIRGQQRDLLRGQIHRSFKTGLIGDRFEDGLDLGFRQLDGEQSVLGRVAAKNVGKCGQALTVSLDPGRDDDPIAVLGQRPDRMLTA